MYIYKFKTNKKTFYYLQTIANRTKLSWAKSSLSSYDIENKNLLHIFSNLDWWNNFYYKQNWKSLNRLISY